MSYFVEIVEIESGNTEKSFEASTLRQAEKMERGININLDQGRFYTNIRET